MKLHTAVLELVDVEVVHHNFLERLEMRNLVQLEDKHLEQLEDKHLEQFVEQMDRLVVSMDRLVVSMNMLAGQKDMLAVQLVVDKEAAKVGRSQAFEELVGNLELVDKLVLDRMGLGRN